MEKRIKKKTKVPPRSKFEIGGALVAPGTKKTVELPVARLPVGSMLSLPIKVVHGLRDGPTIWLSAAIHGDELNGVPIIRRVLRQLDPKTLVGTVIAVPVVNVFGLVNESRYLPDRRDLNRNFPGSARGSLASQLAHLFMNEVVSKCELGLDLHTGSGGRSNLPQIRCDLDDKVTRSAARHFGTSVVMHSKLRDGSLRAAACELGIPVLLYEAGEASRFDPKSILIGVDGTLRVMAHLGMIDTVPAAKKPKMTFVRKSKWIRATGSGFLEISVQLGDVVKKGDVIAIVYSTLDRKDVPVRAPAPGIIIGRHTVALVHRGDAIVHIADKKS